MNIEESGGVHYWDRCFEVAGSRWEQRLYTSGRLIGSQEGVTRRMDVMMKTAMARQNSAWMARMSLSDL